MIHLPPHSNYKAALDDSDRLAQITALLRIEEHKHARRVPLVGYDGIAARLDNVYDALNNLQETLVVLKTRKRSVTPNRAPRPETAHQRLKRQQSMHKINSITDRMTGGR